MTIEELNVKQAEVIKLLQNARKKDKLVHAYLFEGDSGTGTLEAAKYFAMMLLCEEKNAPCLKCRTCERIEFNSHLNVVLIEPFADMIRKEQIENLMHDFSLTALERGPQIYIIKDADKMNASAANSLLKFLEEPAPNHYAVLLTTNHKKMLDTIISRCQFIHFKPVSRTYIEEQLLAEEIDPDLAYVISHITSDLAEARKYAAEGKLNIFLNLAKKVATSRLRKKDPYVDYYLNRNILTEEKEKSWHFIFFDTLILIYQEMLNKLNNQPTKHFAQALENVREQNIDKNEILRIINVLNTYEERLNYNVNIELLYSSLFVEI